MGAPTAASFTNTRLRTLVVSANTVFRAEMVRKCSGDGLSPEEASSGAQALAKLRLFPCDVLLLDTHLPDLDSMEIAEFAQQTYPDIIVRCIDSRFPHPEIDELLTSSSEPAPAEEPSAVANALENGENASSPSEPAIGELTEHPRANDCSPLPRMIGNAKPMQQVYRLARLVATRNTTVLITGETGTGKEVIAQAIHDISHRARSPFIVVNCAAIPETLLEAELFGHTRGAFTGAVQSRIGRIHAAQGGTLFLDEVGELPLSMQAKLLRFLQGGEVQRLGSSDVFRVDARVICATNVQLVEKVRRKEFRKDLYFRLAVFPIDLPPLRERPDDIAPLAEHFLVQLCKSADCPPKRLAASSLALLRQSSWSGNVRELEHAIERAFILSAEETQIRVEHFGHLTDPGHLREF
jgi:DNA-binding NtrC family response regulator